MSDENDPEWARAVAAALPPFAQFMGVRITRAVRDRVEGELAVTADLANRNGVLHGGGVMAFADILGGAASVLNLAEGARTTTIESKTNFFQAVPIGETATGVCIPLHRGRTTMVWQTTLTRADGKRAAIVTQTQLVMGP